MAIVGKAVVSFIGMLRQRVRHAADGAIVVEVDRARRAAMRLPIVPAAHQRMLQDRQLVGIVADVIEQPDHEPRRNGAAADPHRLDDRGAPLLAASCAE